MMAADDDEDYVTLQTQNEHTVKNDETEAD